MNIFIKAGLLILLVSSFFCKVRAEAFDSGQCSQISSVRAAHILVDTRAEADIIKAKLDSGESFELLAKKHSKCPSGEQGGDLGYFERGQMVKSFENEAFRLDAGEISSPVRTQFGWHIIKVYDKK